MTLISFSNPYVEMLFVSAIVVTVCVFVLVRFDRQTGPVFRNLYIVAALGMWALFCFVEALVAIRWVWMTGYYLFGLAGLYFFYRMLHWFAFERPPAWEARVGKMRTHPDR